ncbi:MAG: hypothetical protein QOI12_3835 [Alphaproteobacteria bacterium]|nr:hypothetical protein [Alphaproteobacteria bacterium]
MQSLVAFLKWLESTPLAIFISHSTWGFSAILMIHMGAIAVVFGMIAIVDLRLIGLASTRSSVTGLCREVLPWTWGAFALSAFTGVLLFMVQAVKYVDNHAFRMKFLLMTLVFLNMLVFQFIIRRGIASWDRDAAVPPAGRIAGVISLTSWIAIVAYGRWTAYFAV